MDFSKRYKEGQKVYLAIQGEGIYTPTIKEYDKEYNRYLTNLSWYILPNSIIFKTEEELEEYKKTNKIYINHGCNEFGYVSKSDWGY